MKREEKGDGLYGMFQHSAAGKRKREEGGSRSRELSPRSAKAKGVMYEVGYSMPALSNIHQSEKIIKTKKEKKKLFPEVKILQVLRSARMNRSE
jgi:hypothetical protein